MISKTFLLAAALVAVGGTAYAGPCTDRISQIDKVLNTSDAGSGPTKPMTGDVTGSVPASPSTVVKAGEAPGTGGTAGMNATIGAKAASPSDVRAQTQGSPTAAQGGAQSMQVSEALSQAKAADAKGDSAACSKAIDDVERLMKG